MVIDKVVFAFALDQKNGREVMRIFITLAIALIGATTLSSPAMAEGKYDQFNDRFRIYLGGFWPQVDSKININGEVPGSPISVEDTLGVEDSSFVGWGGAAWKISRRNSLELEFFALNRDGGTSGTFNPPIQISDYIITGGGIDTSYDTSIGRLTYGFSVVRSERMDVQLKLGLHLASLEAGIRLNGQICDSIPVPPSGVCPTTSTESVTEDVTAPLPHLGASFAYAITPSLAVNLQVIGFALELDSIDGSIIEVDADLAWQPWRHFGVGVGARYFNTDVEAGNPDLNGEFDFSYFGPVLYVQSTF
jgi:hypothetical protein